jgi:hypothetical protein
MHTSVREPGPVYERPVPVPYSQGSMRRRAACAGAAGLISTCARPTDNDPSKLARVFFQEVAWLILYCARRTRPFRGRAFREQEDDQAASPFRFRAPRKGCRERRWSERAYASSVLIGKFQMGRTISTAASRSILPSAETFPSRSFRTIRSICTMAPRCQLSTAAL